MKFSLRELIFCIIAAGATIGMITNNYWMEQRVRTVRQETKLYYEKKTEDQTKKYEILLKEFKKINPLQARLYELDDDCNCHNN